MPRAPALSLPVALALAATGCNPDFAPQYLVTDVRILAVRADAPEPTLARADALPDEVIRLSALVANPRGRSPVHYRWIACAPRGDEGLPPCLDASYLRDPDRLASAPGATVVAEGEGLEAIDLPVPDVTAALEAAAALADADPAYACRPYVELPIVLVLDAGSRREVAMKTVPIAPPDADYVRNVNPEVYQLKVNATVDQGCDGDLVATQCATDADCTTGTCQGAAPGQRGRCAEPSAAITPADVDVCAWPDWRTIQGYEECAPDGTRNAVHETPSWQWYVSDGEIDDTNTIGNAVGERVRLHRPDGAFTIWVLVHDGRGGTGWLREDVPALAR